MFKFLRTFIRHYRQLAIVASLVFATALCVALLVLRWAHTHNFGGRGLLWNLFLAWLPALSSLMAYNLYKERSRLSWVMVGGCALIWLLFFPNAPYLLTDLIHFQPQNDVPFWYDLILFIAFAWTGFFLGLVSLFLMQTLVRKAAGTIASWLFAFVVLGLSSFGIYLGRFLGWNSWDVFTHPAPLFADIVDRLRHPLAHFQTFVFSLLFSLFFISTYLILVAVTQFNREVHRG